VNARLSYVVVQMVQLGFAAVASLAQTWDSAEPDEDEDGGKALANWKMGCTTVAITFSELLQRAWLAPMQVRLCFSPQTRHLTIFSYASQVASYLFSYDRSAIQANELFMLVPFMFSRRTGWRFSSYTPAIVLM